MKASTVITTVLLVMLITSCSGGNITTPAKAIQTTQGHSLWGLWQFTIDPVAETLEFTQMRMSELHLNALPFLEPPALAYLTLETLVFNGNIIDADIGIRHPFLGLNEFTGFDVCGIFISNGSLDGFSDPDIRMTSEGDTRLLNPDGYSRWWNPVDFPINLGTIYSYNDGLLGTPYSSAYYNCTVNGYKYFTDQLGPNDPVSSATVSARGVFSAGQKNVRHYTIEIGNDGLIFNYAIDASWVPPSGPPPYDIPGDFGPEANRPEAWNISVTLTENTLWNDGSESGGHLELLVDVYDHYCAELNTVTIDSPGNFPLAESLAPVDTGMGYARYELSTTDETPAVDSMDILISVVSEAEYGSVIPDENITAYFSINVPVAEEPADDCLELVEVAHSSHSYFYTKTMNVIQDQTTWVNWWDDAVGTSFPPPPPPVIDWENETVIAVTMGEFSTGGFYPTIDWACFDDNDDLEIMVTWHCPGPDCYVTQVFTQPWLAVKTEKYTGPYYWTEDIDIYPCD